MKRLKRQRNHRLAEALEARALLTTITVTSLDDSIADDGAVTLREAVLAANTDESVDGSVAGNGADKIVFAEGLKGTVDLTDSLVLTESVELVGHGTEATRLRGTNEIDALVVPDDSADVELVIRKLRITSSRRAVYSQGGGSVSVTNSRLRHNDIGVFWAGASAHIANTEVYGSHGDALLVRTDEARISNSRFIANEGGIVIFDAEAAIDKILYHKNGDEFLLQDGVGEITNSTFTENKGGIRNHDGELKINYSTIVGNTSTGIVSSKFRSFTLARVYVGNSVVAQNILSDGTHSDILAAGPVWNRGVVYTNYTFIGATDRSYLGRNNIAGSLENPLDPLLGPLADNGGPFPTMQPQPGSPLINTGSVELSYYSPLRTSGELDIRGVSRSAAGEADIGAVEIADVRLQVSTRREVVEGNDLTFRVTLAGATDEPVSIRFRTVSSSAASGRDFDPIDRTLKFDGSAGQAFEITIPTFDDSEFEWDERIGTELSLESTGFQYLAFNEHDFQIVSDETAGLGLSDSTLVGLGSDTDDDVTIDQVGDQLVALLSGQRFEVPVDLVSGINLDLLEGANVFSMPADLEIPATVVAGTGDDTVFTGSGDDEILTSGGADLVDAGPGKDTVHGGSGRDTITGNKGGDLIFGGSGNDSIMGAGGSDEIHGDRGRDTLEGGDLSDKIYGGQGRDLLDGGTGNDKLFGFMTQAEIDGSQNSIDQPNTLIGGLGNDQLTGGYAYDRMEGGADVDTLSGFGKLFGGDGNDVLTVVSHVALSRGSVLAGGLGNDSLLGSDLDDTLNGGSGKDTLKGLQGNDRLVGSGGADIIWGDLGNDLLLGGDGDDQLLGGSGGDTLEGGGGHDLLDADTGLDHLVGGEGRDVLSAGPGADTLFGGDGEDLIISGDTKVRDHFLNLMDVQREWASDRTLAVRQANLTDGSGSNDRENKHTFIVEDGDGQNVYDDEKIDVVSGGMDTDWFFVNFDQDEVDFD